MALNINNNVSGLFANRNLLNTSRQMSGTLEKLSSGLRINKAADGPASLVISELLRSQTAGFERAVRNTQEASNVLSIAEGALSGMSEQLTRMRQLALHALNSGVTSPNQVGADQAELNGLVSTVGNLANTTRYSDQFLLNGAQDFTFSSDDPNEILDTAATTITQAPDIAGQSVAVSFSGEAADQAEKAVLGTDLGGGATLAEAQEFTVTGTGGSQSFSFAAGTSVQEVADRINEAAGSTGVSAYAINDTGSGATELRLASDGYGSQEFVQVEQTAGNAFAAQGETVRDAGQDVTVTVNGQRVQGEGLNVELTNGALRGSIRLTDTADGVAQTGYGQDALVDAGASVGASLENVRGGMRFQLGEGGGTQNREVFGLRSMSPTNLGRVSIDGESFSLADLTSGGTASLAVNPEAALQVIDQAIDDVSGQRAQIGAYQANTLQTNINSLNVALENTVATESGIRDADMASQISNLIRDQILQRTGIFSVQTANVSRQNVLRLLG